MRSCSWPPDARQADHSDIDIEPLADLDQMPEDKAINTIDERFSQIHYQ
jgi:hypothetical protein